MKSARLAASASIVLAVFLAAAQALAAPPCHVQTLSIQGQSVRATFCVTGVSREHTSAGEVAHVSLSESLVSAAGSVNRTASKDVLLVGQEGRLSDDLPLRGLGVDKTLHVTFLFSNGGVTPEGALLIPGAIPIL